MSNEEGTRKLHLKAITEMLGIARVERHKHFLVDFVNWFVCSLFSSFRVLEASFSVFI